ncbi:hypothetical protein BT69DRAFT_130335 [Atractiella rhizophila]|nr:hypothetical protein BT69DRAFT_130335 [Atractiella rhizophila]
MRALAAKQEAEERELLLAHHSHSTPPSPPSIYHQTRSHGIPGSNSAGNGLGNPHMDKLMRTKSGDLYGLERPEDDAASKSLPGTRRHSGEMERGEVMKSIEAANQRKKTDLGNLVPGQVQVKGADGHLLNSFLFDDEIDSELQTYGGKYLQMNTDDDKFPILVRRDSFPNMVCLSVHRLGAVNFIV